MVSGITDGYEAKFASFSLINLKDLPLVMIMHANKLGHIEKYKLNKEINQNNIIEFSEGFRKGSIKRFLKSEKPPSSQNDTFTYLVGSTFDEIVKDPSKDVMVVFVKNNDLCPTCYRFFEDIFYKVALDLAHNKKELIFARIDSNENELIGFNIREEPSMKLFKMNDKNNPIEYNGEKKDYLITEWLMEHSSNPIPRYPKYDL